MPTSQAVTRGIRVHVESFYVPERSAPSRNHWFFAYRITIHNDGEHAARLRDRHWIITDANGRVEHVKGPGVVGKQPRLEPGTSFEYTSFCPLATAFGTMQGSYTMETDSGESFEAEIATFSLCEPFAIN